MSFKNVGRVWSLQSFEAYLKTIKKPDFADKVVLHHTWAPSLAQRPNGFLAQHLINMRDYYQKTLGWSSGPHLFIDDDDIFGMTPLGEKGIHAASFNASSLGIEVLGNYDSEEPDRDRGKECWQLAADTTYLLLEWLDLKPSPKTIFFHRDDPKTSKTCPGLKVHKEWFIEMVKTPEFNKKSIDLVVPEVVPVAHYVVTRKGYTYDEVKRLLKIKNKLVYFGEDWLEGAYYDPAREATVAPIGELEAIARKT